jgi:hypothetical protein
MKRDIVTPRMCEEVKRILQAAGVPYALVYKDEHLTIEMQGLQSIAGAYAVITAEHDKAARFNMQKLPGAVAAAEAQAVAKAAKAALTHVKEADTPK